MSYETKYPDWKEQVINASIKGQSGAASAAILGIKYDTYKKYAKKYECFVTNQSGKGMKNINPLNKYKLQDILDGKHPQYKSYALKNRLIKASLLEHKCNKCGVEDWNGEFLALELNHINGNSWDHTLKNLEILCPNCHAQTPTYRGRNRGRNTKGV
jgi:hypothetical protein